MLSISTSSAGRFARKLLPDAGTMRFSSRSTATQLSSMTAELRVRTAIIGCLTLALSACSPFSGYVSDNWPHWAGGEPTGLPPRPGSPGYAEYIAHGQAAQNPEAAGGAAQSPSAVETTQTVSQAPASTPQKTSIFGGPQVAAPKPNMPATPVPAEGARDDASVVRGGLY
jgi:hypothetical protein